MEYLYGLMALGAIALPLSAVYGLMEWQARREAARRKRLMRKPS
ncbi:hypothetical protein SNE35_30750 [Paucibacter sp. R3-3]|uniref:Heme exporter protein D n=1 Tax=Roseateles agri TaxID=3098619 RepID=A0ABU5DU72_9BURK|nr:hypothetical protein [Paucibacter sp. R3-3]MDY0748917.1 hypothetical protein [Paucibacter sp. R3-3]